MTSRHAVTLATDTLHNPAEPRHFMALKPITRRVRVYLGNRLLADSLQALRLVEVGRSVYQPMIYIPAADLAVELTALDKTTHCPLQGEASYFALQGEEIAWGYDRPLDFAQALAGLRAFWPDKVRVVEGE